jgi:hypothetical protein
MQGQPSMRSLHHRFSYNFDRKTQPWHQLKGNLNQIVRFLFSFADQLIQSGLAYFLRLIKAEKSSKLQRIVVHGIRFQLTHAKEKV